MATLDGGRRWCARQLIGERDRWVLWVPVGFGAGIGSYFSLSGEPPMFSGPLALILSSVLFMVLRARGQATAPCLALVVVAAGFTTAQIRTAMVPDHMLKHQASGSLSGTVLAVQVRPSRTRLVIGQSQFESAGEVEKLSRARISLRPQTAHPEIGAKIEVFAALRPPPAPSAPDAYDFQRAAFFKELSAVGYAIGPVKTVEMPVGFFPGLWLARYRFDLSERIRGALPGPAGALASALLTGERGALSEEVLKSMRDSGLAHLLAISGLHMGLVAGIVFFGLRGGLALSRRLALRYPIKKWAALGALIFAAGYLLLSGASVPTQRAFLMTGVVLIAVLVDREAISMRLVAWAAMVILVFRPEALLSASFHLSFAAVTALVAAYEFVAARRRVNPRANGGWLNRVLLFLGALLLTSVVANLATLPFGAYHFNRVANYGLASNMIAVPLAGFWIMPWGVLALALAPFGLENWALTPMGWGLDVLVAIAKQASSWPGAVISVAAWPPWAPPVIALAGAWLCLWQRAWRSAGAVAIVLAMVVAVTAPTPRIWVTGDGRLAGYLAADGRMLLSASSRERFTADLWSRRAGGGGTGNWRDEPGAIRCDDLGCILRIGATVVAFSRSGRALGEDCQRGPA
ncbi:MAG: ComEC/Rec2 family competence protein [Proteobacteria bacterium]|nr:ComEC/Rec2 family competence protein [Pseudomonadota bacterium]